ncbi:MAG: M14 family zinc carboxypeptidase [Bdellovibrionota bacterium]
MKFILLSFVISVGALAAPDLTTIAEKSNWKQTGRADETDRLCKDFQKAYPKQVKCNPLGKTPEGRTLYSMIVGNLKDPVVWVQAGIHAGEIDGKDATFWLLKDILAKKIQPDPLKGLCLVFIPIMNLDGHERFGKYNRPNQIGPEEMGWRVTSQNYNLNRDYMKVDASEMRMITTFWRKVNPVMSLDLHVTDGAQFQPEVGLVVLPNTSFGESLFHKAGSLFETQVVSAMKNRGHSALPFYPSFEVEDDPKSGFSRYVALPRFSQSYWFNQYRMGMLVETHSWKDYATRVKTHYDTVLSTLEIVQKEGHAWRSFGKVSLANQKVALEWKHTDKSNEITFPGYEYKKIKSPASGAEVIEYNPEKKQDWKVPFYEELVPSLEVSGPTFGYYIQPQDASMILPILDVHGIKYEKQNSSFAGGSQVFYATKTELSPKSFEGHQTLKVTGEWKNEDIELPNGSYFVPIAQRSARLVLHLFEPQAQDSLLSWGLFNRYFEQKEYMESYVAHQVGLEMLKDLKVKAEFEKKLEDKEFAKNPEDRLQFFYKKHPSWDVRLNRYPVYKL